MTPNPIRVRPDQPLEECAKLLRRHGLRHLPVVDERGRAVGMIQDHVVWQRGALVGAQDELWVPFAEDGSAGDVQGPIARTAHPDDSVQDVLHHQGPTDHVLIVDPERGLVGILTEHDLVRLARAWLDGTQRVGDVATPRVRTVQHLAPAQQAWEHMLAADIRHVVVVDEQGAPVGIVSLRDLVAEDVPNGRALSARDACRTLTVHATTPDTPLAEAADELVARKIGCLPVLDGGVMQGILTRSDVIASLRTRLEDASLFGEDEA